ncbi:MAG: aminotransferase class III-fold pyridoxal phosphate-dependent enzyme, partial [Candidatus Hydrogenedentes bacterium]|nr:aminotransferase class III-fold pyridoxal phosphate-dependent enzyme [Candidatus Hydrogenedentota bacterium]
MPRTRFEPVKLCLADLLGEPYIEAVCRARAVMTGNDLRGLSRLGHRRVQFLSQNYYRRLLDLLPRIGRSVTTPVAVSAGGATTSEFARNSKPGWAPLSTLGFYRVGEDGRLFLTTKSEHYHVPLGHGFPGYALIEWARRLGIPNATHNNTRGHVTRLLEEELVRAANGIRREDDAAWRRCARSKRRTILNRVLNLETGSLAAEAALKMMLSRFYRIHPDSPPPQYPNRLPVFVVIGDEEGGLQANYHGTTIFAQMLRGMWPEWLDRSDKHRLFRIVGVRPNNFEELRATFQEYEMKPYKIAGFIHEFVLMNYAGKRLIERFVRTAYSLCRKYDIPTLADEIQSCVWSPKLFLYHEYGVKPTFVAVGKGLPGGEYPASRLLFSAVMDTLPQFGALVTNGQE